MEKKAWEKRRAGVHALLQENGVVAYEKKGLGKKVQEERKKNKGRSNGAAERVVAVKA